jgi:hypothetical protein
LVLALALALAMVIPGLLSGRADAAPSAPLASVMNGYSGDVKVQMVYLSVDGGSTPFHTPADTAAWLQAVSDYWVRESRGVITSLTALPVVAANSNLICNDGVVRTPGNEAAQALGYANLAAYRAEHPATAEILVVVTPQADITGNACAATSTAKKGGATTYTGAVIWIKQAPSRPTEESQSDFAHEAGHVFGLGHAGAPSCPAGVVDDAFPEATDGLSQCDNYGGMILNTVYGDQFNIMGNSSSAIRWGIHAQQKLRLGIVGEDAVPTYTNQTPGTWTVNLEDTETQDVHALQGLTLVDYAAAGDTRDYSVEYNRQAGGNTIRRIGSWSGVSGPTSSQILSPEGSNFYPYASQVFPQGSVFTSASGHVVITVQSAAGSQATLRVQLKAAGQDFVHAAAPAVPLNDAGAQTAAVAVASSVTVQAAENTGEWGRSAEITLTAGNATETLLVCQPGTRQLVVFCPDHITAPGDGTGTGTTTIAGYPAFISSWVFRSDVPEDLIAAYWWAPLSSGYYEMTIRPAANDTGASRAITMRFGVNTGYAATLTIDSAPDQATIATNIDWWAPGVAAGDERRIRIVTNQDEWRLVSELPDWLAANRSSGPSGTTSLLTVTAANPGQDPRYAEVVFQAGDATATVVVAQAGLAGPASPPAVDPGTPDGPDDAGDLGDWADALENMFERIADMLEKLVDSLGGLGGQR